jgi:hypothetical protein
MTHRPLGFWFYKTEKTHQDSHGFFQTNKQGAAKMHKHELVKGYLIFLGFWLVTVQVVRPMVDSMTPKPAAGGTQMKLLG